MATTSAHVILRKEDLDPSRISQHVVVVVDTLFATTSIVTALAEGAHAVLPALDAPEAKMLAAACGDGSRVVLAGEYLAQTLPGFIAPTPLALSRERLNGKTLVYSTTNGTVALRQAAQAREVYVACLRNARATAAHIAATCAGQTVLVLCAGSSGLFNLEDFHTAGWLVRQLQARAELSLNDAALAACGYASVNHLDALRASSVGRFYAEIDAQEVEFAAQADRVNLVARLLDGRVESIGHSAPSASPARAKEALIKPSRSP